MNTNLKRRAKGKSRVKVKSKAAQAPAEELRVVILHNHPRYEEMTRKFTKEFSPNPAGCVFTFDLNQLPEASNRWRPSFDEEIPIREDEPVLVRQFARADRIFVGIDPAANLPSTWKVALWALAKIRTHGKGSLVHLEDGRADPEITHFLEDLATLSDLDLVRWKPGATGAVKLPPI